MNKIIYLFVSFCIYCNMYGQLTQVKELSLNNAIEIALKKNPELNSSFEKINASKGKFWSSISLPMPEVGISYEFIPKNLKLNNYSEKTLEIKQSMDFPTNYFLRGAKSNKETGIAEYEHKANVQTIILKIKSAYFNALAKAQAIKTAGENLAITEDFYKKACIRYDVGEGTNLEKLTAKVQYTEALNNLDVLKNQMSLAFAEINFALGYGKNNGQEFILSDSLTDSSFDYTFEKLVDISDKSNPAIKASELKQKSASIDKLLAWSNLLPGFNFSYLKQFRDGDNGFYGASFGISIPLWFMLDQRGKIEESSALESVSGSEFEQVKNAVYLKIKSMFTDYKNSEKQVQLYKNEILPQSVEVFQTASKSYDAGEITYLEYLQAKQILINSRSNYINILLNYNLALASLEEAVGENLK